MKSARLVIVACALAALTSGCVRLDRAAEPPVSTYVLSTAHPEATAAGATILERGGSALDAAVAVEAVLGLVEPQSSGIGGGGFLVHWDPDEKELTTYDGRETAPASTQPGQFLGPDGEPKSYFEKVLGGQSVGVPGVMPMLALAHAEHGELEWATLMQPAERLADDGFEISPRLSMLTGILTALKDRPETKAYFYQGDGAPKPGGTLVTNPQYADVMRALAENPRALNEGPIAEAIAATALDSTTGAPNLTLDDLSAYEPKRRAPVCAPYRTYRVCGMGPPSSGGVTVGQILGLLERFDLKALGPNDPAAWHLFAEAMRLAYADRLQYLADPDVTEIPLDGLLDRTYLRERSQLIDPSKAGGMRAAGSPPGAAKAAFAPQLDQSRPSTTHFSIIDGDGNIVSMTASIEGPFGSHIWVNGFLLNNELTDFSAVPTQDGKPVANAAAPGKRPLSSMSPTIVFDAEGTPVLVIGSPGGKSIIAYVAKTLIGVLDFELPLQEAIDLPNVVNQNGPTRIEDRPDTERLSVALEALGHEVKRTRLTSGLNGIDLRSEPGTGAADKRREGTVAAGQLASGPAPQMQGLIGGLIERLR